jgi:hypothetical protein
MTQAEVPESHEHEVVVDVNYREIRVPRETTGKEIKERAALDLAWSLFIVRGREETPVGDDETLSVHEREHFVSTPCLEPS